MTEREALDGILARGLDAWEAPGAALVVVRPGEVLYCGGRGVRDNASREPVTAETLFAMASVTKAFTTCLMAMLVDEGRMAWDDPVRKHLDWFRLADPLADANVTLRDLVTHRTGLSRNDMLWYRSPWDREEIVRRVGRVALARSFRSVYQYNNTMFMAAGLAVGAAEGSTWEEVVARRIFTPLGMHTANCSSTDAERAPDHASPHRRRPDGAVAPIPWLNFDAEGPGGTVNASAREMARWLRFQLGEGELDGRRLITAGSLRETRRPQMVVPPEGVDGQLWEHMGTTQQTYGMGWSVWDYRGHGVVSHGGAIDGFRSTVILVPGSELGVGVFVNVGPTQMHLAARNAVLDHLLGLPPKDWNGILKELQQRADAEESARKAERAAGRREGTSPSREMPAYAGVFTEPAYGELIVEESAGGLLLRWSSFTAPLVHFHHDLFDAHDDTGLDSPVQFRLDERGEVSGLRFLGQEFTRSGPAAAGAAQP